jgi:hypothetical protein
MANAIAGIPEIGVRVILDPSLPGSLQIFTQFLAGDFEQWSNDIATLRINPTQPGHPRAANQLQEKRLGLIVPRMPDRHSIGSNLDGTSTKRFVAQPPCGILNRETLRCCVRPDVHGLNVDGHADSCGEFAAEPLVAVGIRPELVIDVCERNEAEAAVLRELAQEKRQRHRV